MQNGKDILRNWHKFWIASMARYLHTFVSYWNIVRKYLFFVEVHLPSTRTPADFE